MKLKNKSRRGILPRLSTASDFSRLSASGLKSPDEVSTQLNFNFVSKLTMRHSAVKDIIDYVILGEISQAHASSRVNNRVPFRSRIEMYASNKPSAIIIHGDTIFDA